MTATREQPAAGDGVCGSCFSGRCHWNPDGTGRRLGDACTCPDHDRSVATRHHRT